MCVSVLQRIENKTFFKKKTDNLFGHSISKQLRPELTNKIKSVSLSQITFEVQKKSNYYHIKQNNLFQNIIKTKLAILLHQHLLYFNTVRLPGQLQQVNWRLQTQS